MARRRRPFPTYQNNYNNFYGPAQRGLHLPIANLPRLLEPSISRVTPPRPKPTGFDRRRFYPDSGVMRKEFRKPHIPPAPNNRKAARLVLDPFRPLKQVVAFAAPKRVLVCVRRKIRKEVILATGKGGGSHRKPRRTEFSNVRC